MGALGFDDPFAFWERVNVEKYRVLIVLGTRPEAIKMAPLVHALKGLPNISLKICATAQHREMQDSVLGFFGIHPDYDLNIMKPAQSLGQITNAVLAGVDGILAEFRPHRLLVHGDTTSAMSAALAAFYRQIPIGHVEAGLRTGSIKCPWPEEMNRRFITMVADRHFVPTDEACVNLRREGVEEDGIFITGNTVVDALLYTCAKIEGTKELEKQLEEQFRFIPPEKKVVLVTAHRRENHGSRLVGICEALRELAIKSQVHIVFPVHPNPAVQGTVHGVLGGIKGISLLHPLEYVPFVYLMNRASLILTDSGGIQEEAPSLGTPVLVLREDTERPEALRMGAVRLVGTDKGKILKASQEILEERPSRMKNRTDNPYGDGAAALRIAEVLKQEAASICP